MHCSLIIFQEPLIFSVSFIKIVDVKYSFVSSALRKGVNDVYCANSIFFCCKTDVLFIYVYFKMIIKKSLE